MNDKRQAVGLIPYRVRESQGIEFFLQKRDRDACQNPDRLGIFGGGIEFGESIEEALQREMKEELCYKPTNAIYFSRYEHAKGVSHLFIELVGIDFESLVEVHEGKYGTFLTLSEVRERGEEFTDMTHVRIMQINEYLERNSAHSAL